MVRRKRSICGAPAPLLMRLAGCGHSRFRRCELVRASSHVKRDARKVKPACTKDRQEGLHTSSLLSHIAFDFWESLVRRCFQQEADGPRWASALGLAFLEVLPSGGLVIKESLPNLAGTSLRPLAGLGF